MYIYQEDTEHYKFIMRCNIFLLIVGIVAINGKENLEDVDIYYYGVEESERGLSQCSARQACAVVLAREWRRAALVRTCRCARRSVCASLLPSPYTVPVSNRGFLQFCEPVMDWPQCALNEIALVVETSHESLNPDDLEEAHHKNQQLEPPSISVSCRCPEPNYWKLNSTTNGIRHNFQCHFLPICHTDEFCGYFRYDLNMLYQSCQCPRHHMCVHKGGVEYTQIRELLYRGKGRKAFCRRIGDEKDYSYEDY